MPEARSGIPRGGPGRTRLTIADIAREVGVSPSAVSFALNGRPGVSEATRTRILQAAERMNWHPHSAARALGGAQAGAVGLVLARPTRTLGAEPFYAQLIYGMQSVLSARSVALLLQVVDDTAAEVAVYRRWAGEQRVDGLLLVDPQTRDPRMAVVEELGVPAIVLGGSGRHGSLPSIWADDREAMLETVRYLAALGHTRIAHVAGTPTFQHTQRRIRALKDAAEQLSLTDTQSVVTDYSDTEGAAATRRLLSLATPPTAIVYDSDLMAVAGLGVAAEMGVPVPDALSVVSFEDSVLTRVVHPAITALSRDAHALGVLVGDALVRMVDQQTLTDVKAATPRLTVRESTARPKG
jgi:DNA-binding LacI/PurR family transcriptional regulator